MIPNQQNNLKFKISDTSGPNLHCETDGTGEFHFKNHNFDWYQKAFFERLKSSKLKN